jgi:hypothetical protein
MPASNKTAAHIYLDLLRHALFSRKALHSLADHDHCLVWNILAQVSTGFSFSRRREEIRLNARKFRA